MVHVIVHLGLFLEIISPSPNCCKIEMVRNVDGRGSEPLAFGFVMLLVTGHGFSLLRYDFGDISIVCSQIDSGVWYFCR